MRRRRSPRRRETGRETSRLTPEERNAVAVEVWMLTATCADHEEDTARGLRRIGDRVKRRLYEKLDRTELLVDLVFLTMTVDLLKAIYQYEDEDNEAPER
jgi:hypothetical protein